MRFRSGRLHFVQRDGIVSDWQREHQKSALRWLFIAQLLNEFRLYCPTSDNKTNSFWRHCIYANRALARGFEIGAGRFQARPDQLLPVGGNACACDPARREQLSLLWAPSRCRLRDFSAAAFCAALGDRTLLLVGDSTMQQLASVLMNGLAWEESQARRTPHRVGPQHAEGEP